MYTKAKLIHSKHILIYESTIDRHAKSYQMSLANPVNKVCVFLIAIMEKNMQMLLMITMNVKKVWSSCVAQLRDMGQFK